MNPVYFTAILVALTIPAFVAGQGVCDGVALEDYLPNLVGDGVDVDAGSCSRTKKDVYTCSASCAGGSSALNGNSEVEIRCLTHRGSTFWRLNAKKSLQCSEPQLDAERETDSFECGGSTLSDFLDSNNQEASGCKRRRRNQPVKCDQVTCVSDDGSASDVNFKCRSGSWAAWPRLRCDSTPHPLCSITFPILGDWSDDTPPDIAVPLFDGTECEDYYTIVMGSASDSIVSQCSSVDLGGFLYSFATYPDEASCEADLPRWTTQITSLGQECADDYFCVDLASKSESGFSDPTWTFVLELTSFGEVYNCLTSLVEPAEGCDRGLF